MYMVKEWQKCTQETSSLFSILKYLFWYLPREIATVRACFN